MAEITIHLDNPALLERVTKFLSRLRIAFYVHEPQQEASFLEIARTGRNKKWSDDPETRTIQSRLYEKYVVTGEWDKMDDEDRQDAALGEMMLYHANDPDNEPLSPEETEAFIVALETGTL